MKILCISASNVKKKKHDSGSTKVCSLIEKIAKEIQGIVEIEILPLIEYKLKPCIFCGKCVKDSICTHAADINNIYPKILNAEVIFLIVPHYSIIPAKLTIIMEKLNQFYYTAWLNNPKEKFALAGKKIAIIAHGGGDEKSFPHYIEYILKPLNYLFKSLQFEVIGLPEQQPPFGAVFGVKGFKETDDSIFPDMVQDWDEIEDILRPLMEQALT